MKVAALVLFWHASKEQIERALRSTTVASFDEVIVGDAGGNDLTVVQKYCVRVVSMHDNVSIGTNRNRLLCAARDVGMDWSIFLDGDDEFLPAVRQAEQEIRALMQRPRPTWPSAILWSMRERFPNRPERIRHLASGSGLSRWPGWPQELVFQRRAVTTLEENFVVPLTGTGARFVNLHRVGEQNPYLRIAEDLDWHHRLFDVGEVWVRPLEICRKHYQAVAHNAPTAEHTSWLEMSDDEALRCGMIAMLSTLERRRILEREVCCVYDLYWNQMPASMWYEVWRSVAF